MVVVVTYYKKSVLVTGAGTFDVKDELKGIGGNYNRTLKGWVYSKSKRDAVVTKLRSLPGVDLVDETAAAATAASSATSTNNATGRGASSISARGAMRSSANDEEISVPFCVSLVHSDLASLPTPNKDTFDDGIPGESNIRSLAKLPEAVMEYMMSQRGYNIVDFTENGYILRVESLAEKEERLFEKMCREHALPAGYYEPRISVMGRRSETCTKREFMCDGTMFRHTSLSWVDAPVKFQQPHRVESGSPVISICNKERIRDVTPYGCDVYWKTLTEQCKSCYDADKAFKLWVNRASTEGGQEVLAGKKCKVEEV